MFQYTVQITSSVINITTGKRGREGRRRERGRKGRAEGGEGGEGGRAGGREREMKREKE